MHAQYGSARRRSTQPLAATCGPRHAILLKEAHEHVPRIPSPVLHHMYSDGGGLAILFNSETFLLAPQTSRSWKLPRSSPPGILPPWSYVVCSTSLAAPITVSFCTVHLRSVVAKELDADSGRPPGAAPPPLRALRPELRPLRRALLGREHQILMLVPSRRKRVTSPSTAAACGQAALHVWAAETGFRHPAHDARERRAALTVPHFIAAVKTCLLAPTRRTTKLQTFRASSTHTPTGAGHQFCPIGTRSCRTLSRFRLLRCLRAGPRGAWQRWWSEACSAGQPWNHPQRSRFAPCTCTT